MVTLIQVFCSYFKKIFEHSWIFFGFGRKVFWRNLKNYIQKLKFFPDG